MIVYNWSLEKNDWLKRNRGVCFEQVVLRVEQGEVLDAFPHPNQRQYPGQSILIIEIDHYAYAVPFVENDGEVFFKTMIPSRKETAKYLR